MGVLAERGLYQTFSSSDKQKEGGILYRAIGSNGSMICRFADSLDHGIREAMLRETPQQ
jgi:hypothetical protein